MQNKYDNITIALAGIVQALSLIKELAQTGKTNETAFEACIRSVFATHPENAATVFGDLNHLQIGLEQVTHFYSSKPPHGRWLIPHTLAIIRLQKKVSRSPKTLAALSEKIQQAKKQAEYFSMTHSNVLANLGDTYLTLITPFRFRFLILGNQRVLSIRENIYKIRALLLAAVRAAVLWRQIGGSHLQLLFSYKKIKASAEKMLAQLKEQQRNTYVIS